MLATQEQLMQAYIAKRDVWLYMIRTKFLMGEDDAEDCLSAGIERCLMYIHTFEGRNECSLESWIWSVIRNTTINFIRQRDGTLRGNNNTVSLYQYCDEEVIEGMSFDELAYSQAFDKSIYDTDYDQSIDLENLIVECRKVLEGLPDFVAGVFIDRVFEDMPYEDVMEKWGISYVNARVRVHQARQYLRENIPTHVLEDFNLLHILETKEGDDSWEGE